MEGLLKVHNGSHERKELWPWREISGTSLFHEVNNQKKHDQDYQECPTVQLFQERNQIRPKLKHHLG